MGVGTVADLIEAVDAGMDLFDCVYPTRCGRNGRAMTHDGELNIFNAAFTAILAARSAGLRLFDLHELHARLSRASLSLEGDARSATLSYHNVYLLGALMRDARAAIAAGAWSALRERRGARP